jgi:hypothetical protein
LTLPKNPEDLVGVSRHVLQVLTSNLLSVVRSVKGGLFLVLSMENMADLSMQRLNTAGSECVSALG